MLRRVQPPSADKAFRLEPVQCYRLVVVCQCFRGVLQEQPAGSTVKIRGRVFRFLPYIFVEIRNGLVELLCKEICHATAEIQPDISRPEVNRPLEVFQCLVVIPETALRYRLVVVPGSEDRIQADRRAEIFLRTAQVPEIIFGNAPVEECPIIRRVNAREDIEILDGLGILAVGKSPSSPEEEHILVILRKYPRAWQQESDDHKYMFKFLSQIRVYISEIHQEFLILKFLRKNGQGACPDVSEVYKDNQLSCSN